MKTPVLSVLVIKLLVLLTPLHSFSQLDSNFLNPPASAKPYTWYHWMNGNINKEGITKDIEAMKAAGIGGLYLFDIGWGTPKGDYSYASEAWLEMVGYCAEEAKKNEITFNFHNCSGWSSTGGPWIPAEKSMKWVVWYETQLTPDSVNVKLDEPQPIKGVHDKTLKNYNAHKNNRFYKDIAVIAFPALEESYKISNWERKTLNYATDSRTRHFTPDTNAAPINGVITHSKIIDITQYLQPDGKLNWSPNKGKWTVIRFGYSSNGVMSHPTSHGGKGYEVDKLDYEATDLHWSAFLDKVLATTGRKGSIKEMLIDSYEMGVQNWTHGFEQKFEKHAGYDIISYLPCIAGFTVTDVNTTERFLYDFRATSTALMHKNYFDRFKQKCHENDIVFVTEPYGKGQFDAVEVARMSEVPIGEFWYPDQPRKHWKPWSAKVAASGAHLTGRKVVGAEAFTSWNGDFKQAPSDLKPVMDKYYTMGINRNIFHTYTHQPWNDSVKPGMTMHRFGLNFHRNNTWFTKAKPFFDYMSRCQYIFQSGTYMADVLIIYGEERGFYNLGGSDSKDVFLPGHNYDYGNINVLKDLSVDDNGDIRISFNGKLLENKYKLVLVKFNQLMNLENAELLGDLAKKGARVIADKPHRNPGLNQDRSNKDYLKVINAIWSENAILPESEYEKELIKLTDDCEFHKDILFNNTLIDGCNYYFVVNTSDENKDFELKFRVKNKQPEIWNPLDGSIQYATNWKQQEQTTNVSITLAAHASRFVVFRNNSTVKEQSGGKLVLQDEMTVSGPWTVTFEQWGTDSAIISDKLFEWNEHPVDDIKYYSGTAVYSASFKLEDKPDSNYVLNLGEVGDMARVKINGIDFPLIWHKPFVYEISDALRIGSNWIEVFVTNTWHNRLVGDVKLEKGENNLPDWLTAGKPLPSNSKRKTWVFHEHQKANDKLFSSGLIGPVRICRLVEVPFER